MYRKFIKNENLDSNVITTTGVYLWSQHTRNVSYSFTAHDIASRNHPIRNWFLVFGTGDR